MGTSFGYSRLYALSCRVKEICPEVHAVTKMAKIRQNCQICQADFTKTDLTKIRQHRQLR